MVVLALGACVVLLYEYWAPYISLRTFSDEDVFAGANADAPTLDFPWEKVGRSSSDTFVHIDIGTAAETRRKVELGTLLWVVHAMHQAEGE